MDHTGSNGDSEQIEENPKTLHYKSGRDTNDGEYEGILPSGRHLHFPFNNTEKLIVATIKNRAWRNQWYFPIQ